MEARKLQSEIIYIYIVSQRRNIISVRDILRITVALQMSRFELLARDESRC